MAENTVQAMGQNTVHDRVRRWSRSRPEAAAIATAETKVAYGELDERSDRLAAVLAGRGVGLESRIAVALPRGADMVVAFLAVLKAGGTYVPLDERYPLSRRRFILDDAQVALVVTDESGAADLAGHPVDTLIMRQADEGPHDQSGAAAAPTAAVGPGNAAYIVYTSGSTGVPKGVVVDHASILGLVDDESRIAVEPGQTVAHLAPVAFDASVFEIWGALCRGGRVVVLDARVTVAELGADLRRWTPDWLFLTTGLFHMLAQHDLAALDSVGCLIAGGDVLSPALIRDAAGTRCRVYAAYGPTETTVYASLHRIHAEDGAALAPVSVGTALTGKSMHVLGPDMRPLPAGDIGEIYVGGLGVARGYHGRPALTAERFVPDPFSADPGARMYRTGDLGCLAADGSVDFRGRVDRQVKVRGFRIELGEIESALLSHPDVGGAIVVAVGASGLEKRLAAYVAPTPGRTPAVGVLGDWLGERLPAYMVPATFVVLARIPLDPNGKPDRNQLPEPFQSRAELTFLPPFEPPRTETEQILADVWADVLELDAVGVDDDFFLVGGDSLRSVLVLERLRRHGITLDAGQFFAHSTIRALAAEHESGAVPAGRAG